MNEVNEQEIRDLRDRVYGQRSTDKNWDGCKENWMKPEATAWLRETVKKDDAK